MLQGQEVYLRAIEPEDAHPMIRWENNPENWKISNTLVPFSKNLIEQYVNSAQNILETKQVRFIICLRKNDLAIGTIDLFEFDPIHQRAGVGVLIGDSSYRKRGYADEALKLLIKYSFDRLQLHQLFCHIFETNEASIKLFERNGFEKSGERKEWVRTQNGWETEMFYQLIKE